MDGQNIRERPRIAVPVPTSADHEYNRRCLPDYAHAIYLSGGVAVELPLSLSLSERRELSASCTGIVLPGSPADVDPLRYGQSAQPECAPPDPGREAMDLFLIEEAAVRGIPLLAICFGAQILNVSHGGTLLQDLTVLPVNHAAGRSVATAHSVLIDRGSRLESVLLGAVKEVAPGQSDPGAVSLFVNSSHHQAVGVPGSGLRVSARCPQDAVVEAFEGEGDGFLVGVQWHPERSFSEASFSQALFASFMVAASGPLRSAPK